MKTKWSKLAHKVHQNILLHDLLTKEKKLLIAFSGGRDSVVLFYVLKELATFWKWKLLLGHINHSLRVNEDEKETEFCRNVAKNFKIELLEKKINVQKYADENRISIEKAARKLRYDVFNKWMNNYSIDSLVTGHHQSDQAETIMYRLFTGSGFSGLSGIPYKRGKIIRPILDVTREEINNYIFENELDFMEDSSNSDSNFQRNRIRNKIIPFLCVNGYEQIESNLAKSGSSIASVKIAVNYFIEKEFDNLISIGNGVYKFKISEIEKLPNFAIDEILRMIFKKLVNINRHSSQKEILQLRYFILKSETGSIYKIDNDYQFIVNRDNILISKIVEDYNYEFDINSKPIEIKSIGTISIRKVKSIKMEKYSNVNVEYFNVDIENKKLYIRDWKNGDRMVPFGMKESKKVSDILTNAKIDVNKRIKYPVIFANNEIVWIPGVKRAEKFIINNFNDFAYEIIFKQDNK